MFHLKNNATHYLLQMTLSMSESSTKEFINFYSKIKNELDRGEPSSELNSDRLHNAAIMKLMLDNGGHIQMFCGCLSVFRPQFYEKLAMYHQADTAEYIKVEISKSLSKFLSSKENKLEVIMESEDKNILSDMIIDKSSLTDAIKRRSLSLSILNSNFLWGNSLNHFTFCAKNNMIRLEEDKIAHSGIYLTRDYTNDEDDDLINDAIRTFRELKSRSRSIA